MIHFREGSTHYYLPAPMQFSVQVMPTWRDHVSMNESIWRDFTTTVKYRVFTVGWGDLRPSELAIAQAWWDRMILSSNTLYYVHFVGNDEWTLSQDRATFTLKWSAYTGKRDDADDFEILYQTQMVFRGQKGDGYVIS